MAIYHLSVKTISRSSGRSATASIAYRSAEKIIDHRTGEIFDYTRKQSVDHTQIIGYVGSREELWNKAELAERRKDATVAREYEIAFPKELSRSGMIALGNEYGEYLHKRHGVAVDVCYHNLDSDNPHAHILTTTRVVNPDQTLGDKAVREWSDTRRKKHGYEPRKNDLIEARQEWEKQANIALEKAQLDVRIDHRSFKDRGIEKLPTQHLGVSAHRMEKRGIETERGHHNRLVNRINERMEALTLSIQRGMDLAREKVYQAKDLILGELQKTGSILGAAVQRHESSRRIEQERLENRRHLRQSRALKPDKGMDFEF